MTGLDIAGEMRTCAKGHEYESKRINFGGKIPIFWTGCPECDRLKRLEEAETFKRVQWEKHINGLIASARVPLRFHDKTLDNFEASSKDERLALAIARDYLNHFEEHFALGRCLILCGRPGTGKTHLGCAIATSVARSNRRALYTTVVELVRRVRSTWSDGARESEAEVLKEIENLHLLVLDEVGAHLGGNAELVQLGEIVDLRYRANRPTLVISNYPFNELGKYLGDRAVDRLRENGGKVVPFDWASHRGKNGN